jgi:hypothetical protein
MCYFIATNVFAQLDSQVLFLGGHARWVEIGQDDEHWTRWWKKLGIEVTSTQGKDVTPIVHYNLDGISMGDGRNGFWGGEGEVALIGLHNLPPSFSFMDGFGKK